MHLLVSSWMSRSLTISPPYPSITHAILFHQTHGYISMPNKIRFENFLSGWRIISRLKLWNQIIRKGNSSNLPSSKTQNFSPLAQLWWALYIHIQFSCKWIASQMFSKKRNSMMFIFSGLDREYLFWKIDPNVEIRYKFWFKIFWFKFWFLI